jgi:hypothetical protein
LLTADCSPAVPGAVAVGLEDELGLSAMSHTPNSATTATRRPRSGRETWLITDRFGSRRAEHEQIGAAGGRWMDDAAVWPAVRETEGGRKPAVNAMPLT